MSRVWHIVHNPALSNRRPAPGGSASARPASPAASARPPFAGAHLWAAWHRRALSWPGGDDTAWVNREVLLRLPCGECSRHAKAYLADHPPYFTAADYFAWTVAFHNAVNARLGRPTWTVAEARLRWSPAPS